MENKIHDYSCLKPPTSNFEKGTVSRQSNVWICLRGAQKIKQNHYIFPSHGGFSIGKIKNHRLNKPRNVLLPEA